MDKELKQKIDEFKSKRDDEDVFSALLDMAQVFGSHTNDLKRIFVSVLEEFTKVLAAMGNCGLISSECSKCGSKIFVKDGCPLDCKVCDSLDD